MESNRVMPGRSQLAPLMDAIEEAAFATTNRKGTAAPKTTKPSNHGATALELLTSEPCTRLVLSYLDPHQIQCRFLPLHPQTWALRDTPQLWAARWQSAVQYFRIHRDAAPTHNQGWFTDLFTVAAAVMKRLYGRPVHALHRSLFADSLLERYQQEIPQQEAYRPRLHRFLWTDPTLGKFTVCIGSDRYMNMHYLGKHYSRINSNSDRILWNQDETIWVFVKAFLVEEVNTESEENEIYGEYEFFGMQKSRGIVSEVVGATVSWGQQLHLTNFFVQGRRHDNTTRPKPWQDMVQERLVWLEERGLVPASQAELYTSLTGVPWKGSQLALD